MRKRNLPQPFQIDKVRFADCFTAPSLRHLGVFIIGWVLNVGVHTISQVIPRFHKQAGVNFVHIDPRATPTVKTLGGMHLSIRPGTDGALVK
jgi:hypothetical protein